MLHISFRLLSKKEKKMKKIFSSMVCCTSWTECVSLVWHIAQLTETKVFSYYPKWKTSQNSKNTFFSPQDVPAQLASDSLCT